MKAARLRAVIAGRPFVFLGTVCLVVGLVALGTLRLEPQYKSTAQVFLQGKTSGSGPAIFNHLTNEADLVRSERVALGALRLLGLQRDPALQAKWQQQAGGRGDFEPWAAEQLAAKLAVKPARESNLLSISYTSPDPRAAARTANAFVQSYLQAASQIREEGAAQLAGSFTRGTAELKAALDAAEEKLATFQRRNGVGVSDERFDAANLRMAELSARLVAAQSAASVAAGRERQARADRSGMQEVVKDPLVASLSTELAKQEARLDEMRPRLGSSHPAFVEQEGIVNSLRQRVEGATQRATSTVGTEYRVAAESVATIQAAMEAQRARVVEAKALRDEALRLQRDADLARKAYDAAVIRMNETAWDSGASRGSASVVREASVPVRPDSPRLAVNLAAAVLLGLLAGVAAACWREARDKRLRLPDEVPDLLGQPLVAVLSRAPRAGTTLQLTH